MKSIALTWGILAAGILGLILLCTAPSSAQKQIDAAITFNEYDVMYLADFIDVKSQKISSNISGISLALTNLANTPKNIYINIEVDVVLQGDKTIYSQPFLVKGKTNIFTVQPTGRILAARDFSNSGRTFMLSMPATRRMQRFEKNLKTLPRPFQQHLREIIL